MAAIPINNIDAGGGASTLSAVALVNSPANPIAFVRGARQTLVIRNLIASPNTSVLIKGSTATTIPVLGAGANTINVSAGFPVTVPASSTVMIDLDSIADWLTGSVTVVNDGVSMNAHVLQ